MLSVAKSKVAEALDLAAGIPTDVTFQVHDGEKGVREFKAHKFCLALVSEVFRARLFGSLRETADILDVKGTTPQAFETMISFIYHRNCQWKMKTLEEIIEIANIRRSAGMPSTPSHSCSHRSRSNPFMFQIEDSTTAS